MDETALRHLAAGVLNHPEHAAGLGHLGLRIEAVTMLPSGLVRIGGVLSEVTDPAQWATPNTTVRLSVPVPDDEPVSRVYTIRRFDPSSNRVDIDFVVHPEPSPVMRWLAVVAPGDKIAVTGPRQHQLPLFAPAKRVLLLADSSAVPALASILAHWPPGVPASVHATVAREDELAELPPVEGVDVEAITAAPGGATLLLQVAERTSAVPELSVWAAGERDEMKAIRSHFRHAIGLPKEAVQVFGYWKHGVSNTTLDIHRILHLKTLLDQGKGMAEFDEFDINA